MLDMGSVVDGFNMRNPLEIFRVFDVFLFEKIPVG